MLKRLTGAVLALSMLGTAAATAQPWHGGYRGGYHDYHRHGSNGAATALGIGLGLFALAAIASASNDHDRYYERGYYGPPPPPPPSPYRGW